MNLLKLFCRPTLTEELSEALIFQQRKVMLYELAAIEASANLGREKLKLAYLEKASQRGNLD